MNFFKNSIYIFIFLFVLQLCKISCTHFTILPLEKDCFYFKAEQNNVIVGSYEVMASNATFDIFILNKEDKKKKKIFESSSNHDNFELQVLVSGVYSFCYENKGGNSLTIIFNLRVKEGSHITNESELSTVDDVNKINNKAYDLYEQFLEVYYEQERMMEKSDLYKQLSEKINSKLILWSEIQIVLLIVLTFIHIYYIKSFFEIKTIV